MAYVDKVMTAIKVKMLLNRLSVAKENALRELMGLPPKRSWFEECTSAIMTFVKEKLCQTACPCCVYDRNRVNLRPSCWTSPTFKEFVGFLGGVVLTFLLFLMMIYQMDAPPEVAFTVCAITGLALTLTMAFSQNIRCLILLMLPQFFSGKGRMLLLLYALFLAMNHPMNNVRVNIGVMAQSTTCGQEMAINGTKELIKSAVAPMQSVMESIKDVLEKFVDFANTMKKTYNLLKQTVMEIGAIIKRIGQWLLSIVDRCNEKMGSPYKKCQQAFDQALSDCRDAMGLFNFVCGVVSGFDFLCHIVRAGELLCLVVDAIKNLLESTVGRPVEKTLKTAKEMFYFNVSIKYMFQYTVTQSKNYSDIRKDITKEITTYMDNFLTFIRVFRNLTVITVSFVLIKALIYRSKWFSDDRYDNIYITFTVRDLDERRKENKKSGILPLIFEESMKYIPSESLHMTHREIRKMAFGLIIFIMSLFNAAFYLFCDYGLYSALSIIEVGFSAVSRPPIPAYTKMHVAGSGPMADMYRSVVGMFDPLTQGTKESINIAPCVPHPSVPDWGVYKTIALIYFVCLILTITEAYGLRLRHQIMACYFPRRERKRAIWLFNHILKTRGGVLDNARKRMKKEKGGEIDAQHISIKGRLAANFPLCEKILKCFGWDAKSCLYCGREGKPDDYVNFIHCEFFDCDALYCVDCYADLDNVCAVCNNAIELQGSEGSEEVDSSIDERGKLLKLAQKQARQKKISAIQYARRPSQVMANIRAKFGGVGREMDLDSNSNAVNDNNNSATNVNHRFCTRAMGNDKSNFAVRISQNSYWSIHIPPSSETIQQKSNSYLKNSAGRSCPTRPTYKRKKNGARTYLRIDESLSSDNCPKRQRRNTKRRQRHLLEASAASDDSDHVSSGSSVDSDDLDYDYQYTTFRTDSWRTPSKLTWTKSKRRQIDLVRDDIFTDIDTSSSTDDEKEAPITEPSNFTMWRE